jgi:hypothetical protein
MLAISPVLTFQTLATIYTSPFSLRALAEARRGERDYEPWTRPSWDWTPEKLMEVVFSVMPDEEKSSRPLLTFLAQAAVAAEVKLPPSVDESVLKMLLTNPLDRSQAQDWLEELLSDEDVPRAIEAGYFRLAARLLERRGTDTGVLELLVRGVLQGLLVYPRKRNGRPVRGDGARKGPCQGHRAAPDVGRRRSPRGVVAHAEGDVGRR